MKKPKPCITHVIKHSEHLRTVEKCRCFPGVLKCPSCLIAIIATLFCYFIVNVLNMQPPVLVIMPVFTYCSLIPLSCSLKYTQATNSQSRTSWLKLHIFRTGKQDSYSYSIRWKLFRAKICLRVFDRLTWNVCTRFKNYSIRVSHS